MTDDDAQAKIDSAIAGANLVKRCEAVALDLSEVVPAEIRYCVVMVDPQGHLALATRGFTPEQVAVALTIARDQAAESQPLSSNELPIKDGHVE